LELRRRSVATKASEAPAAEQPEPSREAEEGADEPAADSFDTLGAVEPAGAWGDPESNGGVATPLEETPDWEPHPAAHEYETAAEEAPASEREEGAGAEDVGTEAFPADTWDEPTPTAMTEAAVFDEPDLTQQQPAVAAFEDHAFDTDDHSDVDGETVASSEAASLEEISAGLAAETDIPEEEPFERAGRWWFKRGSELLVYNEQTGDWMPSPTPLPIDSAASVEEVAPDATVEQTIAEISVSEEEAGPELTRPTTQQGFWKCPSCGAVNGSTAATCRMCFAARPVS
jgi:hypothetical protein